MNQNCLSLGIYYNQILPFNKLKYYKVLNFESLSLKLIIYEFEILMINKSGLYMLNDPRVWLIDSPGSSSML